MEQLKDLTEQMCVKHAVEICKGIQDKSVSKHDFNIVYNCHQLMSSSFFDDVGKNAVESEMEALQASLKIIIDSSVLVTDQITNTLVLPPYELLRLIFAHSESFRQHNFHEIINFYYQKVTEKLSDKDCYTRVDFEEQIKILLPVVKLEMTVEYLQSADPVSYDRSKEIISNLVLFFKYPRLNPEDIYAVAHNKLGSKNYKLLSYEMIPLDERNGHLGDYFKLKILVEHENIEKIFNLFAKFLTPKLETMKKLVKLGPSKKEEFFYMTYLPLLEKHGLGTILDFSPRCYFSRQNDVLILDDMAAQEFTALTPNIKLNLDSLLYIVKKIAKFHACSLILEELLSKEQVSLYNEYKEYLQEVVFISSDDYLLKNSLDACLERLQYLTQKFPEITKEIPQDVFKEKIAKGWQLLFKQISKSEYHKNTICHGDMYVGNMLFKFDSHGVCKDATLVDFQLLRFCPPVHDLLFFIYQNSFKETRDKHFGQLFEEYYSNLSTYLEQFGFDASKIYARKEFDESVKYMKSEGLFHALFYSPLNMIKPSTREELYQNPDLAQKYLYGDKSAIIEVALKDEAYKKVLGGLIADLVEMIENGEL